MSFSIYQQDYTPFITLIYYNLSKNYLVIVKFFCSGKPNLTYQVLSIPKQANLISVAFVSVLFFSANCFSSYYSLYWLFSS